MYAFSSPPCVIILYLVILLLLCRHYVCIIIMIRISLAVTCRVRAWIGLTAEIINILYKIVWKYDRYIRIRRNSPSLYIVPKYNNNNDNTYNRCSMYVYIYIYLLRLLSQSLWKTLLSELNASPDLAANICKEIIYLWYYIVIVAALEGVQKNNIIYIFP